MSKAFPPELLTYSREEVGCYKGQLIENYRTLDPNGGISLPGDDVQSASPQKQRRTTVREYTKRIRSNAFFGIPITSPMFDSVANAARRSDPECNEFSPLYMISRKVVAQERASYLALHGCCGGSCGEMGECYAYPGGACLLFIKKSLELFMSDIIAIDSKIIEARNLISQAQGELGRTVAIAKAINATREAIRPVLDDIMCLQNSPLGFLTDKQDGVGYKEGVVLEVMTEGLLRGFSMVGNEINIIAGRFYGAKNGFKRLVENYPGLSNLELNLKTPAALNEKTATVCGYATWKLNGKPMRKDFDESGRDGFPIPVRINSGMGPDAILGKAERKVYAKIYMVLSGIVTDDRDREELEDDGKTVDVASSVVNAPALLPPELSEADKKFIAELDRDIEMAVATADLALLFKSIQKNKPHLAEIVKPKFTAKREQLEAKALAS